MKNTGAWRKLSAASVGYFGELYDFAIFGFSVPILATQFFPEIDPVAGILSTFAVYGVGFFARPVGGLLFGWLADKIGRVKVLSATIWMMAAATALIGLLPSYPQLGLAAPLLLIILRIAQGVAVGGEITTSATYTIEAAPDHHRGRWIGFIYFCGNVPYAFVALFLLILQSLVGQDAYSAWAWRLPFLIGGLVGIVGFWLRKNLNDSDEYRRALHEPSSQQPLKSALRSGRKGMALVVILAPLGAVGAYLIYGFMYTFLVRTVHVDSSLALASNTIGILVLSLFLVIGGATSDFFGRKKILLVGALWMAVSAYPCVSLAATGTLLGASLGQAIVALGVGLYSGASFTVMTELFPTSFRATGHALSYQISVAIFGGFTPFVSSWLITTMNQPLAPGALLALIAVLPLVLLPFVPETKNTRLGTSIGIKN